MDKQNAHPVQKPESLKPTNGRERNIRWFQPICCVSCSLSRYGLCYVVLGSPSQDARPLAQEKVVQGKKQMCKTIIYYEVRQRQCSHVPLPTARTATQLYVSRNKPRLRRQKMRLEHVRPSSCRFLRQGEWQPNLAYRTPVCQKSCGLR